MRKNTPEEAEAKRLERNAERVEWHRMLIMAHICPRCKKQDAYTLGGRVYCVECAAKTAQTKRDWYAKNRNKALDARREYKALRRQQGKCMRCGRTVDNVMYANCPICRAEAARRKKEKQTCNWPRGANGICFQCNKRPVKEGSRLCSECYEMKVAICKRNNANRNNSGHIWRLYDDRGNREGVTR